MEDTRVTFETAKLAKERGFDINGQDVFDLKNNNKIINFFITLYLCYVLNLMCL